MWDHLLSRSLQRMLLACVASLFVVACSSEESSAKSDQDGAEAPSQLEEVEVPRADLIEVPPDILPEVATRQLNVLPRVSDGSLESNFGQHYLEATSDTLLSFAFDGPVPPSVLTASLLNLSTGESTSLDVAIGQSSDQLNVALGANIQSGQVYRLRINTELGGKSASREIQVRRKLKGALGMLFLDWSGDHKDDRITITADARIDFGSDDGDALPIPGLESVCDFTQGDFDRDGREDLALLGYTTLGKPAIALLSRLPQQVSGFSIKFLDEIGIRIPSSIVSLDLFRDGSPDLVVGGYDGGLSVFLADKDAPTGLTHGDFSTPSFEGQAICELSAAYCDGDFLADVMVSLGDSSALLLGDRYSKSGLITSQEAELAMEGFFESSLGRQLVQLGFEDKDRNTLPMLASPAMNARLSEVFFGNEIDADAKVAFFDDQKGELRIESLVHESDLQEVWELSQLGVFNSIASSPDARSIFLCGESGVYQIDRESDARKPELTFDSRVRFDRPQVLAVLPAEMTSRVLVDINHDGRIDVIGIYDDEDGARQFGVWHNLVAEGKGLELASSFDAEGYDDALPADVNNDGLIDVILASRKTKQSKVLRADPNRGTISGESSSAIEVPQDVLGTPLVLDLNGDSFADVVWPTKRLHVSFGSANDLSAPMPLPKFHSIDGRHTYNFTGLVRVSEAKEGELPGLFCRVKAGKKTRIVHLNNRLFIGQKSSEVFELSTLGKAFESVEDFHEGQTTFDQKNIVAMVKDRSEWKLLLWANDRFEVIENFGRRSQPPSSLQLNDIDGDGDDDIAYLFDRDEDFLTLLINRGDASFSNESVSSLELRDAATGSALASATLVDLNGDGKPDLLAHGVKGDAWHAPSRK